MLYDVVPDFETWLVDGSKRGTFSIHHRPTTLSAAVERTTTFEVTLTIVPLRTEAYLCHRW